MKKLITMLLLAAMVCSLVSCGRNKDKNKDNNTTSSSTSQSATGKFPEGMSAKSFLLSVYEGFLANMAPS